MSKKEKKMAESGESKKAKLSFQQICCSQEMIKSVTTLIQGKEVQITYLCQKCEKYVKVYPNERQAQELENVIQERVLIDFWIEQLSQKNYHVIKDTEYNHHGEVILRALQDDLSSLEMKILGEVKGDQTIIYLQPEKCCSLTDECKREPIKLPLIQIPANTKSIKYFDYFPFCWKHPTWGQDKEAEKGTLKDIWKDRNKSSHLGTYFPKAKTELMKKLKNKGFLWEGGEEKNNYLKAICPRCNWTYNFKLTEKYMKIEEQKEMAKAIRSHEC